MSLDSRKGGLGFFLLLADLASSEMTLAKVDKLWLMAAPSLSLSGNYIQEAIESN